MKTMIALILLIVVSVVYFLIEEEKEWGKFKVEHNCKVVSKISSQVLYGFNSKGEYSQIVEPAKTGWACNDGVTYFR